MVPPGLAALWAACLGPNPAERPGAAHAAVMSRQALTGGRAAPSWSAAQDQPAPAPAPKARAADWTPAPKARAADWTEERGERGTSDPSDEGSRRVKRAGGAKKRRRLITVGGVATVATAAAAVVGVLLATSPGPHPASPASSTTAARTGHPVVAGPSPAGAGQLPTPEATSPVLATSTPTAGGSRCPRWPRSASCPGPSPRRWRPGRSAKTSGWTWTTSSSRSRRSWPRPAGAGRPAGHHAAGEALDPGERGRGHGECGHRAQRRDHRPVPQCYLAPCHLAPVPPSTSAT